MGWWKLLGILIPFPKLQSVKLQRWSYPLPSVHPHPNLGTVSFITFIENLDVRLSL